MLGLSGSHVSRMLRSMRDEGLVTIEGHRLIVMDLVRDATRWFRRRLFSPEPDPRSGVKTRISPEPRRGQLGRLCTRVDMGQPSPERAACSRPR